jgi:hypothetical protein
MSAMKPDSKAQSVPDPQPQRPVRGRPFQKGNGGRKPGSKNKTTLVAEALVKGDESAFVRKGRELALAGDTRLLIFFLGRILPKERCVRLDLPELDRSSDAVDALAVVFRAAATGQISPSEAAAFATVVATYARTINIAEFEERLTKMDKELRDLRK